ncbi:S-layer homology domain-containing protein, partial [Fusibacter ferrireducens]
TGATLSLYKPDSTLVSSSPTANGDGTYRFNGLAGGTSYYVQQSINNVVSAASSIVTVSSPSAPTATAGQELISVSDFTLGADLKLYLTSGSAIIATANNITESIYVFNDVVPNSAMYYVTQTVNGVEGSKSTLTTSTLRTPIATAGIGYVDVSNVYTGATMTLYTTSGSAIDITPTANGDGTYRFNDLAGGTSYYVRQSINNVISTASSTVTVSSPSAPTVTAGLESLSVSDFIPGADLKLYLTSGSAIIATANNVTKSIYVFNNVVPNNAMYYVTQTVNGVEGAKTTLTTPTLRTPVATAGIRYVDVSNVYTGATLTLYSNSDSVISTTPIENGDGTYRFSNLTDGASHYVRQGINGILSAVSNTVTVASPDAPGAPTVTAGVESLIVSDIISGANLKLYTTSGSAMVASVNNITEPVYTFNNVVPNSSKYYVTQVFDGVEGTKSNDVTPTLRTPIINAGVDYVDVSNVYPGSIVKIYTTSGASISITPTSNGDGTYRFNGLMAGVAYYVDQTINGVVSAVSNIVTVAVPPTIPSAPTHVVAVAGDAQATVSFMIPNDDGGSPISSYIVTSSPGNIKATGNGSPITVTGLTNGTQYVFSVVAVNGVGSSVSSSNSNAIIPRAPSSGENDKDEPEPEKTPETNIPETDSNGAEVIVNGVSNSTGILKATNNEKGQTVSTLVIDTERLQKILDEQGNKAKIILPVKTDSDIAVGLLNGRMVKNMEDLEATLTVETNSATYTLPASEIDIDFISKQFGQEISLADIEVQIEIAKTPADAVKVVENAAVAGEFSIMVPAMDFNIRCTYQDKTVDISKFNEYIERTIAIPEGVDPTRITTGVIVKADGTTYHVPTKVFESGGKYYAVINSLTNSTYTLIWHPIEFEDAVSHWAKAAINNMGSRMVVKGVDKTHYAPENDITRAEFMTILIQALGLAPEAGKNTFKDVSSEEWYTGYIEAAHSYGISDIDIGTLFRPNDKITREQVMVMIARAMKNTGLQIAVTLEDRQLFDAKYTDLDEATPSTRPSIEACLKAGIITGRSSTTVAPKSYITRAEVAVVIEKLLKKSDLIE